MILEITIELLNMELNKNISVWRGNNTPPTDYHLWEKEDGSLHTKINEEWLQLTSPLDKSTLDRVKQSVDNHLKDTNNPHKVTKAQIGLDKVTNDAQLKRAELGVASGVASLDSTGKVPLSQLPSYVDDVLEFTGVVSGITETMAIKPTYIRKGVVYDDINHKFFNLVTDGVISQTPLYVSIQQGFTEDKDNIFGINSPSDNDPESGKIYVNITTNRSYRWSGSKLTEISKSLALGTTSSTAYPGDKGNKNATDIAVIMNGDLPLVTPVVGKYSGSTVSSPWTIKQANGTVVPNSTTGNLTTTYGYTVTFTGNYMWEATSGFKNPTATSEGDWSSKALPASGVASETITVENIVDDRTFTASIKAPKQGLVLNNGIIKKANSNDVDIKSASIKVHFQYKMVACGVSSAVTATSLADLLKSTNTTKWSLVDDKARTLIGVTTSTTDYYIIAYPSKLGALSKIVMNDATPLLADGFTSQKLTVTDPVTLKSLEYIIYTSVQKGAFTNAKLTIA